MLRAPYPFPGGTPGSQSAHSARALYRRSPRAPAALKLGTYTIWDLSPTSMHSHRCTVGVHSSPERTSRPGGAPTGRTGSLPHTRYTREQGGATRPAGPHTHRIHYPHDLGQAGCRGTLVVSAQEDRAASRQIVGLPVSGRDAWACLGGHLALHAARGRPDACEGCAAATGGHGMAAASPVPAVQ